MRLLNRLFRRGQGYEMPREFNVLADYNSERWRGIIHTPEWTAKMAALQKKFDAWMETL